MNQIRKFTDEEIVQILNTSQALRTAQHLAGLLKEFLSVTNTSADVSMLAFAHALLDPLSTCVTPLDPDGKPIPNQTKMIYTLDHEVALARALREYIAKQSVIVAAEEHKIPINLVGARPVHGAPGKCVGCGTAISANREDPRCKDCAGKVE